MFQLVSHDIFTVNVVCCSFVDQGFQEGLKAGCISGYKKGFEVGVKHGAEINQEVCNTVSASNTLVFNIKKNLRKNVSSYCVKFVNLLLSVVKLSHFGRIVVIYLLR